MLSVTCLLVHAHRFLADMGEYGVDQCFDRLGIYRADRLGHVAGEVHPALLPPGVGQDYFLRGLQPRRRIRGHGGHPFGIIQARSLQHEFAQTKQQLGPETRCDI